jgi:F-type H+-transporting ATPase subunit gamma
MALSLRALRRRVRTVKNTQKITRAMETVSTVKLKRAQDRLTAARPYARKLMEVVRALSDDEAARAHALTRRRPVHRRTLMVVTADRGLCGAFNSNVLRATEAFVESHADAALDFVAVGKRARDYFNRHGKPIVHQVVPLGGVATVETSRSLAQELTRRFVEGLTDEIWLLATHMASLIRFVPTLGRLLPLDLDRRKGEQERSVDFLLNYLFEPSAETLLDFLFPRTVESRIHLALAESVASEHSARRMAMHNATDNCKDLGTTLTLQINKARQAAITKELLEIVGGTEALKG